MSDEPPARHHGLAPDLTIDVIEFPGGVRLVVTGDMDMTVADQLRGPLGAALAQHLDVELDLAGVSFLDSYGLRVLIELWSAVRVDGSLRITAVSDRVRSVLTTVGLATTLGIPD